MAQIRKRGPSQYQARVRLKGYPEQTKTFPTKQEAISWGYERERLISHGFAKALSEVDTVTLYDALGRYANEVTPKKKGWKQELARLHRWQKNPLAVKPLVQIRGADLALYRDKRQEQGISGNTIRLELALISHVYEVARKDWGYELLTNPAKAIRKPKVPKGRNRRLLDGEEEALLAYCEKTDNTELQTVIILAIETAMRRGEIAALTWKDINLSARMAHLDETKNGESRAIPLSSRVVEELRSLQSEPERYLVSIHRDNISAAFAAACKANGIQGLTLHDLRHEATSRLFEKGLNMMEVSTITGHKCLSMLKRYTHLKASDLIHRLG